MKIYDSTGAFDSGKLEFSLDIQLTDIAPDTFKITDYYDISDTKRYAIVAILQTADGNDKNLNAYPPDFIFSVKDVNFSSLNNKYLNPGDKDIFTINTGDTIDVIVHHGIGFDPVNNTYDDDYIKNYKAGTYTYYPKGAPPGVRGTGILK